VHPSGSLPLPSGKLATKFRCVRWITGSLCHSRHTLKISVRSVYNFLSYLANTRTNRQTNNVRQNITSLAEVNRPYTKFESKSFRPISREFKGSMKIVNSYISPLTKMSCCVLEICNILRC